MADNASGGLPNRGATYYQGINIPTTADVKSKSIEGTAVKFMHDDDTGYGPDSRVSGQFTYAKLVRNSSGGDLRAGAAVKFEAGQRNRRVDDVATSGAYDGLVDDRVERIGGVADGDLFWLIYGGPAVGLSIGALTVGDALVAGAAGSLDSGAAAYNIQDTAAETVSGVGRVKIDMAGRQQ